LVVGDVGWGAVANMAASHYMAKFDLSKTEERQEKLRKIAKELKTEFFGLDEIIDRIIDSMQSWYILPEIVSRPIIVNLWGLTGVGKTQVVRSLVRKLGFADKFVEVQMDGFSNGSGYSKDSICAILQSSSIEESESGILLLDEFQRFRTIDAQGQDVEVKRFQDLWMLLSDGRFSGDYSLFKELEQSMAYDDYYKDEISTVVRSPEDEKKMIEAEQKRKYKTGVWQVKVYKKLLKLKQPITELMTWNKDRFVEAMNEFMKNKTSGEIDYSKLLIFICGNLDEAFSGMAGQLADSDTDADIYHDATKKVTVFDIKHALKRRFKPEQIARLGSNHVIYPSLSKSSYRGLIRVTCDKYISHIRENAGIDLQLNDEIYEIVYENSVYPAQGTRPVFSAIHTILSSSLTDFALWCLQNNLPGAEISINLKDNCITAKSGDMTRSLPVVLEIKLQKEKNSIDFNTLVAVHEAGHAIVQSVLAKNPPEEVRINIASFKGGFNMIEDNESRSKQNILDKIAVYYGGSVAEEIVFGEAFRSAGNGKDMLMATSQAALYVRNHGFDGFVSVIAPMRHNSEANFDTDATNVVIENLLKNQRDRASNILTEYRPLLKVIVEKLLAKNVIKADEFVELAKEFIPEIKNEKNDVRHKYHEMWQTFIS